MSQLPEGSLFSADEFKKGFKRNKKAKKEEDSLQLQVCSYIATNHPGVVFFCDLSSGLKLPIWLSVKFAKMRSSRGLPDLFIAYPNKAFPAHAHTQGGFCGLFIELKKEGTRRPDGSIPANWQYEKIDGIKVRYDHHAEQQIILNKLREVGYMAEFACGYNEATALIKKYLQG